MLSIIISVILFIVENLPAELKILQEIWAAVKGKPLAVQALVTLMHKHAANPAAIVPDLHAFHTEHVHLQSA